MAVTVAAVSACSGTGSQKVGVQSGLLANAYNTTRAAHSSAVKMNLQVSTSTGSTSTDTVMGAVQWDPVLGSITENIAAGGQTLIIDARLIGTEMYMELPAQYVSQMGGKPWVKADLSSLMSSGGLSTYDPTQILSLLVGETDSIKVVGAETVDGQKTTHYKAILDLNKSKASPTLTRLLAQLEPMLGGSTLPIDVWIDSSGKLVQMKMTMTLENPPANAPSAEPSGFPITESITENLSDYGVPVSVSAPPTEQVSSINLAQAAGRCLNPASHGRRSLLTVRSAKHLWKFRQGHPALTCRDQPISVALMASKPRMQVRPFGSVARAR